MRREPPVRIREGLGVQFPRATRLVICCRGTADEAMQVMRSMMSRLRLTVNETKTRMCRLPEESFNFLGYTIGPCHSPQTGRSYIGTKPHGMSAHLHANQCWTRERCHFVSACQNKCCTVSYHRTHMLASSHGGPAVFLEGSW